MTHSEKVENLLTTAEVADLVRSPAATVRYWRHTGYGPKAIKVGRRVLYRESDVVAWLDALAGAESA